MILFHELESELTKLATVPALRQITIEVQRVNGINLGQGVCQLPVPEFVIESAQKAMIDGFNRYTNPRGITEFREAIAMKLNRDNQITGLDPENNVIATCGVTGGFEGICSVLLNPGDEVIVLEPSYPYHIQALKRFKAVTKTVAMTGSNWQIDWEKLKAELSPKTKFVLINTPGNPTGKVFSMAELQILAELLEGTDCLVVSDEIYEYMVFDAANHISPASVPGLESRTITMGGYSKTFSITGWRIGYLAFPSELGESLTSILDAIYVCPPAPLQKGVADAIFHFGPEFYSSLSKKYQAKRDMFYSGLKNLGLNPNCTSGAYYMICEFKDRFPQMTSWEFARHLIETTGVGSVPSSDFVKSPDEHPWVRFCLAVEDTILDTALERLEKI